MRKFPAALGRSFLIAPSLFVAAVFLPQSLRAQSADQSGVIVTANELPSAYGAPPAFSRTRFSPTTTAYVLPPGGWLAATIWEGDWLRHGVSTDHNITQEFEVGLPHRFGIAAEFDANVFEDTRQAKSISLEARYALADWNKIPLNPTLFFEYKFGIGQVLHDEKIGVSGEGDMPPPDELRRKLSGSHHSRRAQEDDMGDEDEAEFPRDLPDAVEGRLLLAQDFGEHVEWAFNAFFEQEVSGDRGREWGFAQTINIPVTHDEKVKVGVEMEYKNFTDKDTRDDADNRFVIGPSFSWKPTRYTQLDIAPLFGVTDDSPRAQVFVVFSMAFGGGAHEAEAPVSTRNR